MVFLMQNSCVMLFSPCLHALTFSTPEPRQFPAGTQKPALAGFTVILANTSLGGLKRYPGIRFTVTSPSYSAYRDLGNRARRWLIFAGTNGILYTSSAVSGFTGNQQTGFTKNCSFLARYCLIN